MNRILSLTPLLLACVICANTKADDDVSLDDVNGFFLRQPYLVMSLNQHGESSIWQKQFAEHFLTAAFSICSSGGLTRDSTVLLRSLIEVDSHIIFAFVLLAGDSICMIRDANGKAFLVFKTDSVSAPVADSAAFVVERINQYGLAMQQYNQLKASREDPGGYMKLGLSVALVALGVYGIADGDEGGKIAGSLAILASPFAIVSSIRQIGEDSRREKRISELSLKLKIGF